MLGLRNEDTIYELCETICKNGETEEYGEHTYLCNETGYNNIYMAFTLALPLEYELVEEFVRKDYKMKVQTVTVLFKGDVVWKKTFYVEVE